ncbi:MAG TPA: type IV toxin-antitoxin system AbiEi family antitoxin [Bacteroidota bacterium]|nr:type IV toxin-antitoxin system AbiEi family antitoxin [Bacteroidota bacterium]
MNINAKYEEKLTKYGDLIREAMEAFTRNTDITMETKQERLPNERVDARLQMMVHGRPVDFLVEAKASVNDAAIGAMKHRFETERQKWILITRYVPALLAQKMKNLRVQFMDTAGNAYIEKPLIYMTGNKLPPPLYRTPAEGILGRAGVRVIFALLCNDGLEKQTFRDIAQTANAALGTVAGVCRDLIKQGYMLETGREARKLVRKKELLDKWTTAYAEKLRYKNLIGRYAATRQDFWQEADLAPYNALWGGEVAANKMTRYLNPEIHTIYTHRGVNELVLGLKLRKDEAGNVELRERFWRFENNQTDKNLVPPLLVYADLLATANARNIETANLIYDEYLKRHLGEN